MIEKVEPFVDLLDKLQVTSDQFLLMQLIQSRKYATMYKYVSRNKGFNAESIKDLIERGYLVDLNPNSSSYNSDDLDVTKKFTKHLQKASGTNAVEFWENYPAYIWIEGKQVAARNTDYDKFIDFYQANYGEDEYHNKILNALKFAVKRNLVNMGILKWLNSRQWEAVETQMTVEPADQPGFSEF
jgi:hypothetical protein